MTLEKQPEAVAGLDFDDLLDAILEKNELVVPTSVEGVALAEAQLTSSDLPDSLKHPRSFLDRGREARVLAFPSPRAELETRVEDLARVAREQGTLSEEVKARMKRDRDRAQLVQGQDDGKTPD